MPATPRSAMNSQYMRITLARVSGVDSVGNKCPVDIGTIPVARLMGRNCKGDNGEHTVKKPRCISAWPYQSFSGSHTPSCSFGRVEDRHDRE
ncbi:hypothetical protein ACJ72_06169 [Emergomyces africanus]|uniref:Uncharacterized protein n=1 Tax=Emergomyces africanus TaxID=1955775 RepID=A0A1B7NRV1_9EURO|nr:hypothetical protein ACJ72_06169 [Emergomyces africanus]